VSQPGGPAEQYPLAEQACEDRADGNQRGVEGDGYARNVELLA
jgi:hypothetical protein